MNAPEYKVVPFEPPEVTVLPSGNRLIFQGYRGEYVYSYGTRLQFTHADSNGRTRVCQFDPGSTVKWPLVEPSPLESHYATHEEAYKAIVAMLEAKRM